MSQFSRLVSEGQVGKVTVAIEIAIEKSLILRPANHLTGAEVKRRFEMCTKIFEALRGDLKWGIDRACDKMQGYLIQELDGSDWKPDARTIWAPGDGA